MIILKKLTWSNLFSYGADNCIDFSAEPLTQLVGLNGRGKSSIPLILEEVLFNKNSKSIKKGSIVNRNLDTNKYSASLDFQKFNDMYSVQVSRTGAAQKVKLIKNGQDISSHTATGTFEQIENLMGLDFKTFSQVVYQSSTSSLQFLTATDSNRKKFLIDLLSLDRYITVFETLKAAHKQASDKLTAVRSKKETLQKWLQKHEGQDLTHKALLDMPPEVSSQIVEKLSEAKRQLDSIEATNKKVTKNEQYKKLRDSIPIESLQATVVVKDPKPLVSTVATVESSVRSTKSTLSRLEGLEASCPTCLQAIDDLTKNSLLEHYQAELQGHSDHLAVARASLLEVECNNKVASKQAAQLAEFEKYSALIDSELNSNLLDKDELDKEVQELQRHIDDAKALAREVATFNTTANKHNASIDTVLSQLEGFSVELVEVSNNLDEIENDLVTVDILKKAFSTNGLVAYKIENSVKDLEFLTNDYLAELSDGRFQLTFIINNDKLNVIIIDNGIEIEITALSAGELARVTTATLLAIRKLMASLSKTKINVLFLDETIDTLDTFGKEKLIEVLLKESDLNTFLISHGYSHPLLRKIEVVKEDGISRLEDG